jgi:hypothetical protein
MNRVLRLALLALLLTPALASALELKPAVGLTYSDITKDPVTGTSSAKAGWQVGGTLATGDRLYLEAGAFYAQKGLNATSTAPSNPFDISGVAGVRIPAMVGLRLLGGEPDALGIRVFGGGSAFVVTSVDATGLSKSDFESPTWGAFLGAGVDFLMLFADLQYEWGLTDVSKVSTIDVGSSRSLFLNVGLRL